MSHHVLYSFRRCPYAMRARMALYEADIAVELREIIFKAKPPAMLQASPKGTVPVLVTSASDVIDESYDIMCWALAKHDPEKLRGQSAAEQLAIDELVDINDNQFKATLDRYKYPSRYPEEAIDQLQQRSLGEQVLQELEARLKQHGGNLVATRLTMADLAIFPFVRQFANVDREWFIAQAAPELQKWLQELLAAPRFKAIMGKWPLWQPDAKPIWLPQRSSNKI